MEESDRGPAEAVRGAEPYAPFAPLMFLKRHGRLPTPDELETAAPEYRADYWDALHCDEFPTALAWPLVEFAMETSVEDAANVLQHLFAIEPTGSVTPATIAAINSFAAGSDIQRAVRAFTETCKTFAIEE